MYSLIEYFSSIKFEWHIIRKNIGIAFGYYIWYWLLKKFSDFVIKDYLKKSSGTKKFFYLCEAILGNLFFPSVFASVYVFTVYENADFNLLISLLIISFIYTSYRFYKLLKEDIRINIKLWVIMGGGLLLIGTMIFSFFYEFRNDSKMLWGGLSVFVVSILVMAFIFKKR